MLQRPRRIQERTPLVMIAQKNTRKAGRTCVQTSLEAETRFPALMNKWGQQRVAAPTGPLYLVFFRVASRLRHTARALHVTRAKYSRHPPGTKCSALTSSPHNAALVTTKELAPYYLLT